MTQSNIPLSIKSKIGVDLHKKNNHPIKIVSDRIKSYFSDLIDVDQPDPYVSIEDNFDKLRIPEDHPSRKSTDTFYDERYVLRTHMTCYLPTLGKIHDRYITCGDVYRKDEIDSSHFPVFHQIDGFCIVPDGEDVKICLRQRLNGLIKHLFGEEITYRFLEDYDHCDVYFPFTVDSLEVEIDLPTDNGIKKLEVLGAGTVHPEIMNNLGLGEHKAFAFGIGIERICMALFEIPDIRYLWSNDPRFLNQFNSGSITKFKPYSKYEKCYKDISFWTSDKFSPNDMCAIAREEDRENFIEEIKLIDKFSRGGKTSLCYQIVYRSMDRTLTNDEVNLIQMNIRVALTDKLGVELR
jgi:phenylalanyl-tRNA synthetase alpha chain